MQDWRGQKHPNNHRPVISIIDHCSHTVTIDEAIPQVNMLAIGGNVLQEVMIYPFHQTCLICEV